MANAITTISPATAPTMTSLELVEFINADRKQRAAAAGASFPSKGFAELRHDDFLRKVPEVIGEERARNFSATFPVPGPNGATRQSKGYRLPKREACLMAMSYSYDLQAKVFDRMTALESAAPAARELSRMELIQIAMQSEEAYLKAEAEKHAAEQALALAAPKVAAQERLSAADGSMCVTNAAKQLKMRPKDLFSWLSANKWIYKRAGSSVWLGYQERIQAGLVEHSTTTVERSDGSEKAVDNMRLTAKGLAKLAEALGTEVVA
jgi:phage antirepressor YoqD-like protein